MKKIFIITFALLLLFVGNAQALDIDVWHVIETHTQDGRVIKRGDIGVWRTKAEAVSNMPENHTLPGRVEKVVVPARIETTYWLNEMQNSGHGWHATGRKKGPYDSRAQALQNDPGSRTVRDNVVRYYIRQMYLDYRLLWPQPSGQVEGPFYTQAAAKKREESLGYRGKIKTEYMASLYLDEFFLASRREGPGVKLLTRTYHNSVIEARAGAKSLMDNTSTAGQLAQATPVPTAVVNVYGEFGLISSKANLLYSTYKAVALGRMGAYVGLAERKETEEGCYFWQVYSVNDTQTVNFRWDIKTEYDDIPEREIYVDTPPTNVTYSVKEEIVPLKVETYLIR